MVIKWSPDELNVSTKDTQNPAFKKFKDHRHNEWIMFDKEISKKITEKLGGEHVGDLKDEFYGEIFVQGKLGILQRRYNPRLKFAKTINEANVALSTDIYNAKKLFEDQKWIEKWKISIECANLVNKLLKEKKLSEQDKLYMDFLKQGGSERFFKKFKELDSDPHAAKKAEETHDTKEIAPRAKPEKEKFQLADNKKRYLIPFKNMLAKNKNMKTLALRNENVQELLLKIIALNEPSFRNAGIKTALDFKKKIIPLFENITPTQIDTEPELRKFLQEKLDMKTRLKPVSGEVIKEKLDLD